MSPKMDHGRNQRYWYNASDFAEVIHPLFIEADMSYSDTVIVICYIM